MTNKEHPVLQFVMYACCGVIAMGSDMIAFFLAAWLLFPALTENDFLVRLFSMNIEVIPEHTRVINFCIGSVIAFMVSNATAYILNVLFVFKAGKHNRWKEMGLFFLVSAISVGIGVGLGVVLIQGFGCSTSISYLAKAVSTTLINFAARKFIIFHG